MLINPSPNRSMTEYAIEKNPNCEAYGFAFSHKKKIRFLYNPKFHSRFIGKQPLDYYLLFRLK